MLVAHRATDAGAGVPAESEDIGGRLRLVRQRRRLTLRQIAAAAEISEGHLSQIERGRGAPSIAVLRRIAGALNLTIADLFDETADAEPRVLRVADRPALAFGVLGRKFRLTPAPHRQMDVFIGEFEPGGSTGDEPYAHGDAEEFLLCLRGQARLELGDRAHGLSAGDSIVYRSSVPHRLVETGGRPASILWAMTPPTY